MPTDRCTVHANGAGVPVPGTDDRIGPGGRERRVVFRPELVPPARDRSIPSNPQLDSSPAAIAMNEPAGALDCMNSLDPQHARDPSDLTAQVWFHRR